MEVADYLVIAMFVTFIGMLLMGYPVAFCLAGTSVIFTVVGYFSDLYLDTITGVDFNYFGLAVTRIFRLMANWVLVSLPMFIYMGLMLDRSGIAEKLMVSAQELFGKVRGGLAITVTMIGVLLAASTGIIGASVVLLGLLSIPAMLGQGYSKTLALGTVAGAGTLGILIPPSIMLVVMADQAATSVGKLFAGAVVPGLILSGLYITYILIRCWLKPNDGPAITKEERQSVTNLQLTKMVLKSLVPPMILILGVLGSIFTGIATPTEAAGVGAMIAFIMTLAYGKFSWSGLRSAVVNTAKTSSMVILILVGAACFSSIFMGSGGGEVVKDFIYGIGFGKWGTFIIMMIILFFLGMFIDWIGIIMITFPIFLPIARDLGFDKTWFVVTMAVMLQDSFLTPPFGYALFYLKGVAPREVKTSDIYWGAFPFWRLMELGLIIVVIWPSTITWLANILVK